MSQVNLSIFNARAARGLGILLLQSVQTVGVCWLAGLWPDTIRGEGGCEQTHCSGQESGTPRNQLIPEVHREEERQDSRPRLPGSLTHRPSFFKKVLLAQGWISLGHLSVSHSPSTRL